MTDHLTEDERLRLADAPPTGPVTPLEAAALEVHAKAAPWPLKDSVPRIVAEWRRLRAFVEALKREGPPIELDHSGNYQTCAWCHAEMSTTPSRPLPEPHRPMDDGQPCLWVRIEGA